MHSNCQLFDTLSRSLRTLFIVTMLSLVTAAQEKGVVYIVYGSDTAIWTGMDTGKRFPTYGLTLYTSPAENAAAIMTDAFRNEIRDSYGTPLIMTWWMMSGSIFRDGTNTNVPYANIMTMYLMKKYYLSPMQKWGDELSLHYHTFFWSDYDGDGTWWWNQSRTFDECREDFDFTLAQQLIEEDEFPVSFRSGWHFMDNAWQQRLDEVLPYSMHNAYPSRKVSDTEPTDNIIDWSRAPSTWVPYHPDPNDYQVPGPGRGWNLRSLSLYSTTRDRLEPAFQQADAGNDQIMCLWDHLPDDNIFDNLRRTNAVLETLAVAYPGVNFRFTTAVEGMQRFLRLTDSLPPVVTATFEGSGSSIYVRIVTDEPLFQPVPFVAAKSLGEEYWQVPMTPVSATEWISAQPMDTAQLAHIAVAATDTSGNYTTWHHRFVPPDGFIDDLSAGYLELRGGWVTLGGTTWGTTYRQAQVPLGDSASVSWRHAVTASRPHAIFLQIPEGSSSPQAYRVRIAQGLTTLADTIYTEIPHEEWIETGIFPLQAGQDVEVTLTGYAETGAATMSVDVVRVTPLVPQYKAVTTTKDLSLGYVSLGDTIQSKIQVQNAGLLPITVSAFDARVIRLVDPLSLPLVIPPAGSVELACLVLPDSLGAVQDTAVISFAEPAMQDMRISLRMTVEREVRIVDNDAGPIYTEQGAWANSVVTSYGPTSRYVILSRSGGQYARFQTHVRKTGYYRIAFMVPSSENATDKARYTVHDGSADRGSIYLSQRPGGAWTDIGVFHLTVDSVVTITVWNDGNYTSGAVLRADAIKMNLLDIVPQDVYVIDNDSSGVYHEYGTWHTSVGQSVGTSSRFAYVSDGAGVHATFDFQVWESGLYDIAYIHPTTVNSATNATYRIFVGGELVHSSQRDQNAGSGAWVSLGEYSIEAFRPVVVEISNDPSGQGGVVLRTDAVRATKVVTSVAKDGDVPLTFGLDHAYPNPFNAVTTLRFSLPQSGDISLVVHDLLGREVATLESGHAEAGIHLRTWQADEVPSGVYFIRLTAGPRHAIQKVMLLK